MQAVFTALVSALLTAGLVAGAWAQNGLERFEKELKPQLELEKFTYGNARPLGTAGFELDDLQVVMPVAATGDKQSTVRIQKATIEALDFDRLNKDAKDGPAPRFARLKLEGMTGDDELFAALEPYGVPRVPVDIVLDYKLDPDARVLTLDTLEVSLRGQARLALSLVMDGITDKTDMDTAKDEGRLRSASFTIDDKELLGKLVPAFAKEEGMTPEELVGTVLDAIAGFARLQSGDTLKALDAIASFLGDWKVPAGALALGLKPAKTAGLDDIDKIMVPDALSTIFGFTATYPGTRIGAAKAGTGKGK